MTLVRRPIVIAAPETGETALLAPRTEPHHRQAACLRRQPQTGCLEIVLIMTSPACLVAPVPIGVPGQLQIRLTNTIEPEREHRVHLGVLRTVPVCVLLRGCDNLLAFDIFHWQVGQLLLQGGPESSLLGGGQSLRQRQQAIYHGVQPGHFTRGVGAIPPGFQGLSWMHDKLAGLVGLVLLVEERQDLMSRG
ncbi:hypothetical protein ES703_67333 [subsurface metagenome]